MTAIEIKERLIEEIIQVEDVQLLKTLYSILKEDSQGKEYQLNEEQLAAIEEAEQEIRNGETIPHSLVMDRLEKWLGK